MTLQPAQIEFDGNGRLVSPAYDDIYFQPEDSRAESDYVFLQQGGFYDRLLQDKDIKIAEFGFGTGLNFFLCWQAFEQSNHAGWLHFTSFEKHPIRADDLKKIYGFWPDLNPITEAFLSQYPILTAGVHKLVFEKARVTLTLVLGDIAETLPQMHFGAGVDIWFLDGFAPQKNQEMWGETLFEIMACSSASEARVTTFTAAGFVKRGLEAAGFHVSKVKGYGRKREMITADLKNQKKNISSFTAQNFPIPKINRPEKITILGAGIAGCALAERLTAYGFSVVLREIKDAPAQGASGNKQAMVYPKLGVENTAADQLYRLGFCYSTSYYQTHARDLWAECGVFQMDRDDQMHERHKKIATRGLPKDLANYLSVDNVTGLDLEIGGLNFAQGGFVLADQLCARLIEISKRRGRLETVFNDKKTDNDFEGAVIYTQGHYLRHHEMFKSIPLEGVAGQVTIWNGTDKTAALKTVLCHKGYLAPQMGGVHTLGASFEKGDHLDITPDDLTHDVNMQQLFSELPSLKTTYDVKDLDGRRGTRLATADRLPLMGALVDQVQFEHDFQALARDAKTVFADEPSYKKDIYVLGALGSYGFTTAPYLAECLAAHLAGQSVPMTRDLYNTLMPTRFAVRALKRKTV